MVHAAGREGREGVNPWAKGWYVIGLLLLPPALILGGINILTLLGIGSLSIAALTAWYRPGRNRHDVQ